MEVEGACGGACEGASALIAYGGAVVGVEDVEEGEAVAT